jgi:hypothetical protein
MILTVDGNCWNAKQRIDRDRKQKTNGSNAGNSTAGHPAGESTPMKSEASSSNAQNANSIAYYAIHGSHRSRVSRTP